MVDTLTMDTTATKTTLHSMERAVSTGTVATSTTTMSREKPNANHPKRASKVPSSTLSDLKYLLMINLVKNCPQTQAKASTFPQTATLDPKINTRRVASTMVIAKLLNTADQTRGSIWMKDTVMNGTAIKITLQIRNTVMATTNMPQEKIIILTILTITVIHRVPSTNTTRKELTI